MSGDVGAWAGAGRDGAVRHAEEFPEQVPFHAGAIGKPGGVEQVGRFPVTSVGVDRPGQVDHQRAAQGLSQRPVWVGVHAVEHGLPAFLDGGSPA